MVIIIIKFMVLIANFIKQNKFRHIKAVSINIYK